MKSGRMDYVEVIYVPDQISIIIIVIIIIIIIRAVAIMYGEE